MFTSLSSFHLCLFRLASSREALLLRSIVRTRFQFVGFADVAIEVKYLELIHGVSPSGIAVAALAFWTRDAEAPASSDASASCYGVTENVLVLAVVKAELKLRKIERQILFADMMVGPYH